MSQPASGNRTVLIGELRPDSVLPDGIQALVFEQDTEMILALDRAPSAPRESAETLIGQALEARGHRVGTAVVREGDPLTILAIVHDLGRDPSWEEGCVTAAYRAVFAIVAARGLKRVALPLLGTVHGRMEPAVSRALLVTALVEAPSLERIWLRGG